eukprot:CAMPEP_0115591960 /NCGR_PEP_ID=MMETSP0272-20121206/10543_1 /TAXON_ID=71861 /ORGANISM="Scrippsiella trochoidea, Strain CCMP3099" /LENGTH=224 /DNA_ID=CAMNT_0003027191 /DNA_START=44 /DNA_END=718 /DNA_ORIENTATION=+
MLRQVSLLGIVLAFSQAAEMTWHDSPDCSDEPYGTASDFPSFNSGKVPSECKAGLTWQESNASEVQYDLKWDSCNQTHLVLASYDVGTNCTQHVGSIAFPTTEVQRLFQAECVVAYAECCNDDGQLMESPEIKHVKLRNYVAAIPLCPQCAKVPQSAYDNLVSMGIRPVSCEAQRARRRLHGLPEGPPCLSSAEISSVDEVVHAQQPQQQQQRRRQQQQQQQQQ